MAWIKLETHTFSKLEVYTIAQKLGIDPDAVIGKCCRVWAWFDANTVDGVTPSVTKIILDRDCALTGFCEAMIETGWMHDDGVCVYLPHYDRHNSKTAKARALGAIRQSNFKSNAKSNASGNADGNDQALPKSSHREEKRREDKEHTPSSDKPKFVPVDELTSRGVAKQIALDWLQVRKVKKLPLTVSALRGVVDESTKAGLTLDAALAIACKNGWGGFKAEWVKDTTDAPKAKDWE